jgi:hypothetical protein
MDLNKLPWDLPESYFTRITAFDVIEHLEDVVAIMGEIHRIAAPGAEVHFTVPHFSSANAFTDPTHRHLFGAGSFAFFGRGATFDLGSRGHFRILSTRIFFHPSVLNKLVWRLANRFPETYERRWTWIFPAWFLEIRLEVVKR